jgi:hypothetical protein
MKTTKTKSAHGAVGLVKECMTAQPVKSAKALALSQERLKMTIKTILAPNAPWPTKPEEKPKAVSKRVPPPPNKPSKRIQTDKKFTEWASRNLGANHEIY